MEPRNKLRNHGREVFLARKKNSIFFLDGKDHIKTLKHIKTLLHISIVPLNQLWGGAGWGDHQAPLTHWKNLFSKVFSAEKTWRKHGFPSVIIGDAIAHWDPTLGILIIDMDLAHDCPPESGIYHLVMTFTVGHGKSTMLLRTVNHLFLWAIYFPWLC